MFHALGWFLVLLLMAGWSFAAWAFHGIASWALAGAGTWAGGGVPPAARLPEWLAAWMPPALAETLTTLAATIGPAMETLLAWVPAVDGGLSVLVWTVWGVGSACILLLGLLVSGSIVLLRRRAAAGATAPRTIRAS